MPVFRIKNWADYFENSSSRKLQRLDWFACPRKRGTGLLRLLALDNGPALYGTWIALVNFAAGCPMRGTFARADGKAYTASDIAIVSGFPTNLIQKCLDIVSNPAFEIEWIEVIEWYNLPDDPEKSAESPNGEPNIGTSREMMGDDGRKVAAQDSTKTKKINTEPDRTGKGPTGPDTTEPDPSEQKQNPTPTPIEARSTPAQVSATPVDSRASWGLVADRFRKYGLARVTQTITEAKQLEYQPAQILEWMDWLEDARFPKRRADIAAGAIAERIRTADARYWKPDFGWPPATADPTPTGTVIAYPYANVDGENRLSEKDQSHLARLESEWGLVFDAMSDLEVFSLMGPMREKIGEVNVGLRRSNPRSRLELLAKMESKALGKLERNQVKGI